jgi:hypothetical protein
LVRQPELYLMTKKIHVLSDLAAMSQAADMASSPKVAQVVTALDARLPYGLHLDVWGGRRLARLPVNVSSVLGKEVFGGSRGN